MRGDGEVIQAILLRSKTHWILQPARVANSVLFFFSPL